MQPQGNRNVGNSNQTTKNTNGLASSFFATVMGPPQNEFAVVDEVNIAPTYPSASNSSAPADFMQKQGHSTQDFRTQGLPAQGSSVSDLLTHQPTAENSQMRCPPIGNNPIQCTRSQGPQAQAPQIENLTTQDSLLRGAPIHGFLPTAQDQVLAMPSTQPSNYFSHNIPTNFSNENRLNIPFAQVTTGQQQGNDVAERRSCVPNHFTKLGNGQAAPPTVTQPNMPCCAPQRILNSIQGAVCPTSSGQNGLPSPVTTGYVSGVYAQQNNHQGPQQEGNSTAPTPFSTHMMNENQQIGFGSGYLQRPTDGGFCRYPEPQPDGGPSQASDPRVDQKLSNGKNMTSYAANIVNCGQSQIRQKDRADKDERLRNFQTDYGRYLPELQRDFSRLSKPPILDDLKRILVGSGVALLETDSSQGCDVNTRVIDRVDSFLSDFLAKKLRLKINLRAKYQEKQRIEAKNMLALANNLAKEVQNAKERTSSDNIKKTVRKRTKSRKKATNPRNRSKPKQHIEELGKGPS